MRYEYQEYNGIVRVLTATDLTHAKALVYKAELARTGSVAAAGVAANSAQEYSVA